MSAFIEVEQALNELREGRMLILVDNESRENEGDLLVAAEKVTPEAINFMIKNGGGLVCMPMAPTELDRLQIPQMTPENKSRFQTPFAVSIGAATGIHSGISAKDRAYTIRLAADENSTPKDIVMPGHVFPLRAREGGVLVRDGHTEGAIDLVKLAGLRPAAAICETLNEEGEPAKGEQLLRFAQTYGIHCVAISDIVTYRIQHEWLIDEVAKTRLPIEGLGTFEMRVFKSRIDHLEHVALIHSKPSRDSDRLVRIHSECLTGETFRSTRCDCGDQLDKALKLIHEQSGILLYTRQEGRGIGLINKIKSYALQEQGLDTVEANRQLGFPPDPRDYGIAAQILRKLGVTRIRLITNNPRKISAMNRYGIKVTARVPLEITPNKDNLAYLKTKRDKLGHALELNPSRKEEAYVTESI